MEVRWTSMPPNGCAADRRTPGTQWVFARSGGVVLVTFAETQFCREQNWAHFSAPAGPKPGMASVKSHPGVQGAEHPALYI